MAIKKLVAAAEGLGDLDAYIAQKQWTAISQALGKSRDLREAVGFLTKQSGSDAAAKQAKQVFAALDGVALAVSKKDAAAARIYFDKYASAMPLLIQKLS